MALLEFETTTPFIYRFESKKDIAVADQHQVRQLTIGIQEWNEWRKKDSTTIINLYGADLSGVERCKPKQS
jgi:hypothetical protein